MLHGNAQGFARGAEVLVNDFGQAFQLLAQIGIAFQHDFMPLGAFNHGAGVFRVGAESGGFFLLLNQLLQAGFFPVDLLHVTAIQAIKRIGKTGGLGRRGFLLFQPLL